MQVRPGKVTERRRKSSKLSHDANSRDLDQMPLRHPPPSSSCRRSVSPVLLVYKLASATAVAWDRGAHVRKGPGRSEGGLEDGKCNVWLHLAGESIRVGMIEYRDPKVPLSATWHLLEEEC